MSPTSESDDSYLSPPVQRAAALLRHIADGDRVTNMSQTARTLGINRTTLLRLLRTLEAERLIESDPDRAGWKIGLGLIGLAAQAFFSQDLVQVAIPVADRLVETLGLSAHLAVLDGREVVFVVRRAPNVVLVSNVRVGSRLPAHASNLGRIILAHLPRDEVDALYRGRKLAAVTDQTPVTLEQLRSQLDEDRSRGLAWSDGFIELGLSSVAAPVFDATGRPVAALNVSGRGEDFREPLRRERIGEAVREAAEEISRRLGWHPAARAPGERRDLATAR
ncbi:MAG: IclR family transcriptional regulator [Alphaproteobacteria bacterium]|nr:IclR family transcriptional regulator [Alphaproteobacteria bacterium]